MTQTPYRAEDAALEATGNIFSLTWPDGTIITLDRFKERSDELTAEVTIRLRANPTTAPRHVHQARLNLVSTQARDRLAKQLETVMPRRDSQYPAWAAVLEVACVLVLRKWREGEPVYDIGALPPTNGTVPYQAWPFIILGQPTIVYAEGGIGKSVFARYLALLVQAGLSRTGITVQQANVLYLDWETDRATFLHYIWALKKEMPELHPDLAVSYRRCHSSLVSDGVEIQRIVAEKHIGMVVCDSVMAGFGDDINDNAQAMQYFNTVRSWGTSALLVDHHGKVDTGPIGASGKWTRARAVWEMKAGEQDNPDVVRVGLFHRKVNDGRFQPPAGFEFKFLSRHEGEEEHLEGIAVKRTDIADIPDLSGDLPVGQQIISFLQHGKASALDIVNYMNANRPPKKKPYSDPYIRVTLSRLEQKGRVVHLPDGSWGLAARPET